MLCLHFDGWFQCRLATNPDPSDEPRGVSGFTFAVANEPDLDRIIRFHDPVATRSHGPEVGVHVRSVSIRGASVAAHRLVGGSVDLLDSPRFESRNLVISEDQSGIGIINPFHLQIASNGIEISRCDVLHPADPSLPLHLVPSESLARRAPTRWDGMTLDPVRIADATGIIDPLNYRLRRRELLERDLECASSAEVRAGLEKRIRDLSLSDDSSLRVLSLSLVQSWRFSINGPAMVKADENVFEGCIDEVTEWPIDFWMGAWDADALTGFVRGTVQIPIVDQA